MRRWQSLTMSEERRGIIELLLSHSFTAKEGALDWEWLGIHPEEWPAKSLDLDQLDCSASPLQCGWKVQ